MIEVCEKIWQHKADQVKIIHNQDIVGGTLNTLFKLAYPVTDCVWFHLIDYKVFFCTIQS